MIGSKVKWQIRTVMAESAAIDSQLAEVEAATGRSGRRDAIQKNLHLLSDRLDVGSQIRRFFYVLQLLFYQFRHGDLSPKEVAETISHARDILRLGNIDPLSSRLSFLHAELNLIISQINQQDGRSWAAVRIQQTAVSNARNSQPETFAKHNLALGNRMLRLGHMALAKKYFQAALDIDPENKHKGIARISVIRAERLSGNFIQARELIDKFKTEYSANSKLANRLIWEDACLDISTLGSFEKLHKCIKRGGTHYDARYILEAGLWAKGVVTVEDMARVMKVRSLARGDLDMGDDGRLFKIAQSLEEAYDSETPREVRFERLTKRLESCSQLPSLNQELLVWLAASRCLVRQKAFDLAALCLSEYCGLSLKISGGVSKDVLGLAVDLINKTWGDRPETSGHRDIAI